MKKGVFFTRLENLGYRAPILREINPALFDVVFDAAAAADVKVSEDLAARGMRLLSYNQARACTYDYILMDYNFRCNGPFARQKISRPGK